MSDTLRAEIEALASEYDANGNGTVDAAGVAFDLRALLSEPTGAHLRVLPRERYDAVLDSGPTEVTFETTLLDPVWLTTSSGRRATRPAAHPVQVTTAEELDALPVGSVVLDGMGDAWQRSDADTDWWAPANPFYDEADAANVLEQGGTEHPVTVLYRSEVTP